MSLRKLLAIVTLLIVTGCLAIYLFIGQSMVWEMSPDDPKPIAELDQGWTTDTRALWYGASQGSRLIPLDWLEALEAPGSNVLFMDPKHIETFRFIPRRIKVPNRKDYAQLAVGFVIDRGSDEHLVRTRLRWKKNQSDKEHWVGLNCSACHTSQIKYKGHDIRVEGGASMMGFQDFIDTFNVALKQTYETADKWERFVSRVYTQQVVAAEDKALLRTEFKKLLDWQILEANSNHTEMKYGYGRIDAFGRIYNKVALLVNDKNQVFNDPDAPVSIPFVWSAPQYDKVQYNGIAPSLFFWGVDVGALARNTGEVIGVFGDVVLKKNLGIDGFESSVNVKNLFHLEEILRDLRSPKWPASIFGPLTDEDIAQETKLAERGRELYNDNCVVCHDTVDRLDTDQKLHVQDNLFIGGSEIPKQRSEKLPETLRSEKIEGPGTDPWMACNSYVARSNTGLWSSETPMSVDFDSIGRSAALSLGKSAYSSDLLTITVAGVLSANKKNVANIIGSNFLNVRRVPEGLLPTVSDQPIIDDMDLWTNEARPLNMKERLKQCGEAAKGCSLMDGENNILGYTSRPLNGIWATAPFLHNGSVPTLYDLLLPPDERPQSFFTGSLEFDPVKVGYITHETAENKFKFEARYKHGKVLEHVDGNTNAGHDYDNASLSHDDRMALIAYLKTL